MNIFGERLKDLRVERGWSVADLAEKINHAKSAVSYWERGMKEPTISVLKELCLILEVSADYLLGLTD